MHLSLCDYSVFNFHLQQLGYSRYLAQQTYVILLFRLPLFMLKRQVSRKMGLIPTLSEIKSLQAAHPLPFMRTATQAVNVACVISPANAFTDS